MTIVMLGIDMGKNVCNLAGLDEKGRVVLSKRLRRNGVVPFVSNLPVCGVAMEACWDPITCILTEN
jgi:transposase